MRDISWALLMMLAGGCSGPIQPNNVAEGQRSIDEWETPNSDPVAIVDCDQIAPPLIHALIPSARDRGVAMLADVSALELSDQDAASLIGSSWKRDTPLGSVLVATELDRRRAKKRRAVVERQDSWSKADSSEYAALLADYTSGKHKTYRPYLVRSVAKSERTGGFYASMCNRDLYVEHASLGRSEPPSIRIPLVVFLGQPPNRVFVKWSMAE